MNVIKYLAATLLLASCLSASAQQAFLSDVMFDKGVAAYKTGHYKEAETFWFHAANRGNVNAMCGLAQLYRSGDLGTRDLGNAKKWFFKASRHGSSLAQYQLGRLYLEQHHIEGATKWIAKAAKAGYAKAQYNLASMYEQGTGVKQSLESAASWYLKAAQNNSVPAELKMAKIYLYGYGVAQNNEQAFVWAVKASKSGDPYAKYLLGYMYSTGTGTVYSTEVATIWLKEALADGLTKARELITEIQNQQNKPGGIHALSQEHLLAKGF